MDPTNAALGICRYVGSGRHVELALRHTGVCEHFNGTFTDHPVIATYVVNGTRTQFSADGKTDVLKIDNNRCRDDWTKLTGIQYFANGEGVSSGGRSSRGRFF